LAQLRNDEILVVIWINIRIQDRIEGFFTIARKGKIDILDDIAIHTTENKRESQLNPLNRRETDKIPLDIIRQT